MNLWKNIEDDTTTFWKRVVGNYHGLDARLVGKLVHIAQLNP